MPQLIRCFCICILHLSFAKMSHLWHSRFSFKKWPELCHFTLFHKPDDSKQSNIQWGQIPLNEVREIHYTMSPCNVVSPFTACVIVHFLRNFLTSTSCQDAFTDGFLNTKVFSSVMDVPRKTEPCGKLSVWSSVFNLTPLQAILSMVIRRMLRLAGATNPVWAFTRKRMHRWRRDRHIHVHATAFYVTCVTGVNC